MEQQPTVDQQSTVAPVPVSSFLTRATNVFAAPADLYKEVASAPTQTSSWLVPYIMALALGIVTVFALYNNTSLRQQIFDLQEQGMQKAVEQGKMTQERFDQMKEGMESSGPAMFMLFGSIPVVVFMTVYFFGVSLILWLSARFGLKATLNYSKFLETYGLSTLIGFCGGIVTLLMMNLFDSMHATPGGALLIMSSFDPNNFVHGVLSSLNVFALWQTAVVGIGIAELSKKPRGVGLGIAFGLWLVWVIVSSALGWAR